MLFILQVLRELTLPFFTGCLLRQLAQRWIIKFRGKVSERGPKTSPLRKVVYTWLLGL